MPNALGRLRSGSRYTPSGVAPDQGGYAMMQSSNAGASVDVSGSVQVAGVLILAVLAAVVISHVVAR